MSINNISETDTRPGRYYLIVLYYALRLLACVPPVVASYTRAAPDSNLQFGPGLVIFVAVLGVAAATMYTWLLRPVMLMERDGSKTRGTVVTAISIGAVDMIGGLVAIMLSGGWGSPFWHFWLTSLIIPCVIVGMVWSVAVAAVCAALLTVAMALAGDGVPDVWTGTHRYLYVGSMITLFLLSGLVGYLGDIGFELQRSRRRAETALSDLGAIMEITRAVAVITSNVNETMSRVARTIGERHHYDSVGIYIAGPDAGDMVLAGWTGNADELERYARQPDHVIHQAVNERVSRFVRQDGSWSMAIPVRDDGSVTGVLLVSSDGPMNRELGETGIGNTFVSQIAVGIRITDLRRKSNLAESAEEWEDITGRIQDGIADSMYSLRLLIEAYADTAAREGNPLSGRLTDLVTPTRQLLIDTRQYLYHLLPVLRGRYDIDDALESMVREFGQIAGIPVRLKVSGDGSAHAPDVAGLYMMIQYRLADIHRGGTASLVEMNLRLDSDGIRLSIDDDGDTDDSIAVNLERMRLLAEDMGAGLHITDSDDRGLRVLMDLDAHNGDVRIDQSGDSQRKRIPETRTEDGH